jgi:hypothetical protein
MGMAVYLLFESITGDRDMQTRLQQAERSQLEHHTYMVRQGRRNVFHHGDDVLKCTAPSCMAMRMIRGEQLSADQILNAGDEPGANER